MLTVHNAWGTSACTSVQIIHNPLTATPPTASSPIVRGAGRVYVANSDSNTVTAIDETTLDKAWEKPVGIRPRTLALSSSGELWVVNEGSASVSVLDGVTGALSRTIALPYASRPYGIAFRADPPRAYVTLQATRELIELDAEGECLRKLPLPGWPRGIAIAEDDSRILVTRFISTPARGEVWEIAPTSLSIRGTLPLHFDATPDTESSGRGVPNFLTSIAISPDGRAATVPSKKDNIARGMYRDGQPLTFESRVRTIVSRLDLTVHAEAGAARLDLNDRDMAQAAAYSPLGDLLLVATQGSNHIEVVDANTGSRLSSLSTGLAPQGLVLSANGSRLFVNNFMSRSVSVFDTSALVAATSNAAPLIVEIPAVATELLTPQVLRGKRIFYNAADPRMNQDGYLSCASCHLDGGHDGQVWDLTQNGEGLRNTIDLAGRGGLRHGRLHWTANFDEVQDFEDDIRELFRGRGFLSDAAYNATEDPLGAPKAGLSPDLDALAAYVSSLDRVARSPFRAADGTLTPAARAGKAIFAGRNCATCHSGTTFRDGLRHDVGTILPSSGQGRGAPLEGVGFDTPTLLGLASTGPYLHDGRAATLGEVLTIPGHGNADTLSEEERSKLVAYLLQINDHETVRQPTPRVRPIFRHRPAPPPN